MEILFSIIPVVFFLTFLFLFDNFKIVRVNTLITCLIWGLAAAVGCSFLNTAIAAWLHLDFIRLSRYVSPVIEETAKSAVIFYLVFRKKIGFPVDAAIYGFAAGTGFSLAENLFYLYGAEPGTSLVIWIVRGFGTAVMHGGTTSLLAVILMAGLTRYGKMLLAGLPALAVAIILHSGFNHFSVSPVFQTLIILLSFPLMFVAVFRVSNGRLRHWLEIEFNSEVELLSMIRRGQLADTKAGRYLLSVKDRFDAATVVDLYCYLALYLELSIKAKRNLMLRENDYPIIIEDDIGSKLLEIKYLRKQIGKMGEYALAPLIRMNYRNLWKLNQLKV